MGATFRNLYDQFNVAAFVRNRHDHAVSILRWALILVPMAAAVGTLCAAFLWSLDAVKRLRFALPWLLYLLPLGGFVVGLVYHLTGRLVEGGNNLIVEQIHEPGGWCTAAHGSANSSAQRPFQNRVPSSHWLLLQGRSGAARPWSRSLATGPPLVATVGEHTSAMLSEPCQRISRF